MTKRTKPLAIETSEPGDTVEILAGKDCGFRAIVERVDGDKIIVYLNEEWPVYAASDLRLVARAANR